jgi:hypothetical protein
MLADTVRNVVPTSCNDLVCRLLCAEQSSHCPCRTCPAHTALEQAVQSRCSQLYVVKTCLLCALPRSCLEKWSAAFSCACKSVAVVVQLGCTCPPPKRFCFGRVANMCIFVARSCLRLCFACETGWFGMCSHIHPCLSIMSVPSEHFTGALHHLRMSVTIQHHVVDCSSDTGTWWLLQHA